MSNPIINKAFNVAKLAHEGQLDDSGSSYFETHLIQVYRILCVVTDDPEILAAGLLHDILEDTHLNYKTLRQMFGTRVADLVSEMTHDGKKDHVGFYFPRLHSKDAILIKFADRLSNLSRMENWPNKRQDHYLRKSKFWKSCPEEP